MERFPGPGTVAVLAPQAPATDAGTAALPMAPPGHGAFLDPPSGSQALHRQSSVALPGKSSSPKSPNAGHHHLAMSPPTHAFKVKASEQFDKSGLVAVQNASLHDAQVLEMGLHTLVVSNPEAKGATFGEEGLVLEPPKVQDPPAGLKPILLKDMKIGKYHRGRVLHGRLCTKPVKVRSLTTILEDDSGSAITVLIPKAVPVSCSVAQAERQFPEGARVAIRNPYLRRFADKVLGILIEDPQDVIFLFIPEFETGTDSNGDNGELHKYYTEDWQRQVGTVGKDNFSIGNGDHTSSGSDEDEQDLKSGDRTLIHIAEHDAGPGDDTTCTPNDLVKALQVGQSGKRSQIAGNASLFENGGPGSVKSSLTGEGDAVPEKGKEGGVQRPQLLGTFPTQKGESKQSIIGNGLGEADSEVTAVTVVSDKVAKVAETGLAGENGTGISLPGSAKRVSDARADDQILENQEDRKKSDLQKLQTAVQDAAETLGKAPDAAERRGSNAVQKTAAGQITSQYDNEVTLIVRGKGFGTGVADGVASGTEDAERTIPATAATTPEGLDRQADSQQPMSNTKTSLTSINATSQRKLPLRVTEVEQGLIQGDGSGDDGKEVTCNGNDDKPPGSHMYSADDSSKKEQLPEGGASSTDSLTELNSKTNHLTQGVQLQPRGSNLKAEVSHLTDDGVQEKVMTGTPGSLVLDKSMANGVLKVSGAPVRGYDSGPEDLFDYDFKDANTHGTDAIGGGPETRIELVGGAEKLSNGNKGLTPSSSISGEAENGTYHEDSHDQVTPEATRTKVSSQPNEESLQTSNDEQKAENNKIATSGISAGTDKDALPSSTLPGHAEVATEQLKPLEISPEGSAKSTNYSEGRRESLTLLSLQFNAEPQSEAVQDRTASAKKIHDEEGKAIAEVGESSERRPPSPVSSPVIPPNISAYALRIQGNRWFGQGDWKKAVSFYTWGIRQALKEHKATVSAANIDLKNGLPLKKKNVLVASSDASPSGGNSSMGTTIPTHPKSKIEGVTYPEEEEVLGVTAASVSPRTYSEILIGFSNRSEAWLRLQQYEKALIDSERALELDSQHLKSVFRKGRALLGLGEYLEASSFLQAAKDRAPSDKDLQEAFQACQIGDKQSRLGVYDLSEYILKDRFSGGPVPRCADYVGPVSLEHFGREKGYGLVITRDVEAGSLLLVSNPLVFVSDSCSEDADVNLPPSSLHKSSSKAREKLASVIREQGDASTRNLERLLSLCHAEDSLITGSGNVSGPSLSLFTAGGKTYDSFYASAAKKLPLQQQLDATRITSIIHHNAFDRQTLRIQVGGGEQDEGPDAWEEIVEAEASADHNEMGKEEQQRDEQIYGIWALPSFINHSCLPNTSWILVGKTLFVVASQDLVAGEEITFNYFDVLQPLAERRNVSTSGWGFLCTCPRCSLEDRVDCHLKKVKDIYSLEEPGHSLDKDLEVSSVVCSELEQVFDSSLQALTAEEQNWIRASFIRPHFRQLEQHQRSDIDKKQLGSISFAYLPKCLEALETVCPGSMETMRISVLARELAKRSNGKKSASYRLANTSSLRICRCTYGKQKTNVLQALVTKCRESLASLYTLS